MQPASARTPTPAISLYYYFNNSIRFIQDRWWNKHNTHCRPTPLHLALGFISWPANFIIGSGSVTEWVPEMKDANDFSFIYVTRITRTWDRDSIKLIDARPFLQSVLVSKHNAGYQTGPPSWVALALRINWKIQKIHALHYWDLCLDATTSRRGGIHLARHFIRSNLSNLIHHCCRCHFISDSLPDGALPDIHGMRKRRSCSCIRSAEEVQKTWGS